MNGTDHTPFTGLVNAGAHLVRCGADKAALDTSWQDAPWTGAGTYVLAGHVPGRIDLALVDLDHEIEVWRARTLAIFGEPLFVVETTKGEHLYYMVEGEGTIPNAKIGPYGDIRGDNGYAILWEGAVEYVQGYLDGEREGRVFSRGEFNAKVAELQSHLPKAEGKPNGRGRGHTEGDRNQGAFVRARVAAENDDDPLHAALSAMHDAKRAGQSDEEALVSVVRGLGYGGRKRSVERDAEPEVVDAHEAPVEDAAAVLAAWLAESRPQRMPQPGVLSAPLGLRPKDIEEPVESWGLAQCWARKDGRKYRCAMNDSGRPSWFRYSNETGWEMVPLPYVLNAMREFAREHFYTYDKTLGVNVKNAHAGTTNTIVKPAEEAARALFGISIHPAAMDSDPFVTGLPDGCVVDARKRDVVVGGPEYLVMKSARAQPGDYEGSQWQATLDYHLPDPLEQAYLGCYAGRAFIGGRDREGLFMPGERHSGKTTVVEAIRHAFGDYAMSSSSKLLMPVSKGDFTQDSIRAQLMGKRLVTIAEADEGTRLDAYAIKSLISDDQVQGRLKGQDTVSFDPTWSILFHMNDFPEMDYQDEAAWSRVVVLPFDRVRPEADRDPSFARVLQQPGECAAIVGWLMHHAWQWAEHGMPPQSASMREAKAREKRESMPQVARFLAYTAVRDPAAKMTLADFMASLTQWCKRHGEPLTESAISVARTLRRMQGVDVKAGTGNQKVVVGVRFK